LQVHDELVFDVHREENDVVKVLIEKNMKKGMEMRGSVGGDMDTGENWLQAH